MARIRSIKPEFWADEQLADAVIRDGRLLYIGLWNLADEHGRLRGAARFIKGQVFPYDDDLTVEVITGLLDQLAGAGKVVRYQRDGDSYLFLPNLDRHQRLESAKVPSKIPPPPAKGDKGGVQPPDKGVDNPLQGDLALDVDDSTPLKNNPSGVQPPEGPENSEEQQVSDSAQIGADKSARDADESSLLYGTGSMGHGAWDMSTSAAEGDDNPPGEDDEVDATESHDDESEAPHREDVEKICLTLADRIEANGSKRPNITKRWRDAARRMIDLDGRTLDQVLTAIDWCQTDEFWQANILSVPKLRQKYDQLRLAATRQRKQLAATGADQRPSTATIRAAEGYALSERLAAQEAGQ